MPDTGDHGEPIYSNGDAVKISKYLDDIVNFAKLVGNRMTGPSADRVALDDPWEGLEFEETDTHWTYKFSGGTWRLWNVPYTVFTPTWAGFAPGNAIVKGVYSLTGGQNFHMQLSVIMGSSSDVSSSPIVNMPANFILISMNAAFRFPVGISVFYDQAESANPDKYGVCTVASTTSIAIRPLAQGTTYLSVNGPNETTPFVWNPGDQFSADIHAFVQQQ